jgi:hypothetical protein
MIRSINRVARLVVPGLEVGGLGRADTEQDSQDLRMGYSLSQGRVEAAAAYLDKGEMECRRIGNGLGLGGARSASVRGMAGCWCCPLRKHERRVKIRVMVAAAIPCPPNCVDGELHEIGEPSDLVGPCRLTAWQSAKLIQINALLALRIR